LVKRLIMAKYASWQTPEFRAGLQDFSSHYWAWLRDRFCLLDKLADL